MIDALTTDLEGLFAEIVGISSGFGKHLRLADFPTAIYPKSKKDDLTDRETTVLREFAKDL